MRRWISRRWRSSRSAASARPSAKRRSSQPVSSLPAGASSRARGSGLEGARRRLAGSWAARSPAVGVARRPAPGCLPSVAAWMRGRRHAAPHPNAGGCAGCVSDPVGGRRNLAWRNGGMSCASSGECPLVPLEHGVQAEVSPHLQHPSFCFRGGPGRTSGRQESGRVLIRDSGGARAAQDPHHTQKDQS